MLTVIFSDDVPDSTYFRIGDAEPRFRDGVIACLDGHGSRRQWGQPGVTSTVIVVRPDFVAVHVGFHHKHGGGQAWRYYRPSGRVRWKDLSDLERMEVLDGRIERAPGWADRPGKLRRDRIRPGELTTAERLGDGRYVGYKWLARRADGALLSPRTYRSHVWDGGRLTADEVPAQDNTNGVYAAKSRRDPALDDYRSDVLVRLALSGTVVEHERGYRAEHAEILEVLS